MVKRYGNTNFDTEFCKSFTPDKLRLIYPGELKEDAELMIADLFPDSAKADEPKAKKITK